MNTEQGWFYTMYAGNQSGILILVFMKRALDRSQPISSF